MLTENTDAVVTVISAVGLLMGGGALGALAVLGWGPKPQPAHRLTIELPPGCNPTGAITIEGVKVQELAFTTTATPEPYEPL